MALSDDLDMRFARQQLGSVAASMLEVAARMVSTARLRERERCIAAAQTEIDDDPVLVYCDAKDQKIHRDCAEIIVQRIKAMR